MKRTAAFMLVLILFLCVSLPCAFASASFELPELNMTLDIPDGFIVFTRDTPENDPAYAALGMTKTDIDGRLVTNSEYLHAVTPDLASEIAVSMVPDKSGIFDYSLLSESDVNKGVEELLKTLQKDFPDSQITGRSVYKQGQAVYFCIDYALPAGGIDYSCRAYITVINGMTIQVKLLSKEPITAQQQDMIKGVIDSITFTKVLQKPFSISQYWWVIAAACAMLIVVLRARKIRKKRKEASEAAAGRIIK